MLVLFLIAVVPSIFGQQCLPGKSTGPCDPNNPSCPPSPFAICLTDGECCPLDSIYTTSALLTTTISQALTTSGPCVDKINPQTGKSDCPSVQYLCSDPHYSEVMGQQCPLTCGICGGGGSTTPPVCQDKINPQTGTSDCPNVKYLCNDPTYKGVMSTECPKTCGYCQ